MKTKLVDLCMLEGLTSLDKIMDGYKAYQVLEAALDLKLFDWLEEKGEATREEIIGALKINGMFARSFLQSLVELGLLTCNSTEKYTNTVMATNFLVNKSRHYQGDWLQAVGTPAGPDSPADPRTVVDMSGRKVTLPAEINSIGVFGACGVLNTFVETMGAGDKLCNDMSPRFTKTDKWKYQHKFAPQIKGAPVFQKADEEIDMEVVLKTKPDLCLAMSKEIVAVLENQGLNVVYLEWNEDEDIKKCITLLGEVLNKQDVAEDYIKYFNDMVVKAEQR